LSQYNKRDHTFIVGPSEEDPFAPGEGEDPLDPENPDVTDPEDPGTDDEGIVSPWPPIFEDPLNPGV